MKKICALMIAVVMCLGIAVRARAAEEFKTAGIFLEFHEGAAEFISRYPEYQFKGYDTQHDFPTTEAMTAALLTRGFPYDVFEVGGLRYDYRAVMDKGYCADLSGSQALMDYVGRMHPLVQQEVIRDGKLRALPIHLEFNFYLLNEKDFLAAGYTKEDVPQSFPELLDFLDGWIERMEDEPDLKSQFHFNNMIDFESSRVYTETTYAEELVRMLMESVIQQQDFLGEVNHFDDDDLRALLERTIDVGLRLYKAESRSDARYGLLNSCIYAYSWPEDTVSDWYLSLRLDESQPKLIPAHLSAVAVNELSTKKDAAIALLEWMAQNPWIPYQTAQLFPDMQPYPNPYAKGWLLSPEQIQDFLPFADTLLFIYPGPFSITTDAGQQLRQMEKRLVQGQMTALQFTQELDRMARLMALESR